MAKRPKRTLLLCISTDGMELDEEDAVVAELLRVAERYGAAHVELPLPLEMER